MDQQSTHHPITRRQALIIGFALVCTSSSVGIAQTAVQPIALTQAPPRRLPNKKLPAHVALGPVIPGLAQGAVPQGLASVPARRWLIISYYFDHGRPSMLAVIDTRSNEIIKSLTLIEPGGAPHMGHVGGLAVSPKYLWVASHAVYRIPLHAIEQARAVDTITLQDRFIAESPASFATYDDRVLWIGEFVLDGKPGGAHHVVDRDGNHRYAWICGYRLDAKDDLAAGMENKAQPAPPDFVLVAPEKVQGMAMLGNRLFLSISHGGDNPSKLVTLRAPRLGGDPHRRVTTSAGKQAPCWFLDSGSLIKIHDYPPMSEGITAVGDSLAIITESGAAKYRKGGRDPLDYVVLLGE